MGKENDAAVADAEWIFPFSFSRPGAEVRAAEGFPGLCRDRLIVVLGGFLEPILKPPQCFDPILYYAMSEAMVGGKTGGKVDRRVGKW